MTRRKKPKKHIPYSPPDNERSKVRHPNKLAAERAAEIQMLQNPGLVLRVYQGHSDGWYLTKQSNARNSDAAK